MVSGADRAALLHGGAALEGPSARQALSPPLREGACRDQGSGQASRRSAPREARKILSKRHYSMAERSGRSKVLGTLLVAGCFASVAALGFLAALAWPSAAPALKWTGALLGGVVLLNDLAVTLQRGDSALSRLGRTLRKAPR